MNPKLKFTIEEQCDNTINYLDLTITSNNGTLECSTFRKPTATTIIHNASCHPNEYKSHWGTLVPKTNVENGIKLGFYWNKCYLYIKIETLLKHYYMYSTLFTEINQSV
jgi:hypothetical protein